MHSSPKVRILHSEHGQSAHSSAGIRFDDEQEAAPKSRDDDPDLLRKEEEDIQRAIAESEREAQNSQSRIGTGYRPANQLPTAAPVPSTSNHNSYPSAATSSRPQTNGFVDPNANKPLPETRAPEPVVPAPLPQSLDPPPMTRARALYDFDPDPNQPGELPLRKGDVVRVLDLEFAEWWLCECKGRVGIFPVTWVEVLPDPTPAQLHAEAVAEAQVFSQVAHVDRLLDLLRSAEARGQGNVGDDDELTVRFDALISVSTY